MKRPLFLLLACVLLGGCSTRHDGQRFSSKSFEIYLTAEGTKPASVSKDLSSVRVVQPPVIRDTEILMADPTNLLVKVSQDVFPMLPRQGKPRQFLVVAGGERVFLGVFATMRLLTSEQQPDGEAVIFLDSAPPYLELSYIYPGGVYPVMSMAPNPWLDPRILTCLGHLHKLGHLDLVR